MLCGARGCIRGLVFPGPGGFSRLRVAVLCQDSISTALRAEFFRLSSALRARVPSLFASPAAVFFIVYRRYYRCRGVFLSFRGLFLFLYYIFVFRGPCLQFRYASHIIDSYVMFIRGVHIIVNYLELLVS